jgi:hypothetical protein
MDEVERGIKNARVLGIILFVVGIILAISAAAKMPAEDATYPTTLPVFFMGIVLGVVGNLIWHKNERKIVMAQLEHHKNDTENNPVALLKATLPKVEELQTKAQGLEGMAICEAVDEVLDKYVHPFTEKRKTFMDILGQSKGAEILLIVAYGERMLNRVWSAASDGHKPEAMNVLQESIDSYRQAIEHLGEA